MILEVQKITDDIKEFIECERVTHLYKRNITTIIPEKK